LVKNSATVSALEFHHLGAMKYPITNPAMHIAIWMVIATKPYLYAIEPHTTNVPAEKKLINSDSPFMDHGTDPPAAKKDFMLVPFFPKESPATKMISENIAMVM
jgi:hypothetical protein